MRFNVSQHDVIRDRQIVEVLTDDGRLLAAIYPHEQGIHVVSRYCIGYAQTSGQPPGVLVVLDDSVRG